MDKKTLQTILIIVISLVAIIGVGYVTFKYTIQKHGNQNQNGIEVIIPQKPEIKIITLQGLVKDWVNGKGIVDVDIKFGEISTKTIEDGSFSFTSTATVGELIVSKRGYQSKKISGNGSAGDGNFGEIQLVPYGIVTFRKQSKIFRANYDGSNAEVITNNSPFFMAQSPDGKYVVYVEHPAESNDEVMKIINTSTKVVSEIVRHPHFVGSEEITVLTPRWSSKSTIVAWQLMRLREGKEVGSLSYYDPQERIVHYVKNPSTDYIEFDRVYDFAISPGGQFIAILADLKNESGETTRRIALYDTSIETSSIIILEDQFQLPALREIFFDADGNFHYGVIAESAGANPNLWMTYNTKTGKRDTTETKPAYWNILRDGNHSFLGDKVAVFCPSIPGDICAASRDGLQSKIIVSRDDLGISSIMNFFFSPDSRYLFFEGNIKSDPASSFLWIISSDGGKPHQIFEL